MTDTVQSAKTPRSSTGGEGSGRGPSLRWLAVGAVITAVALVVAGYVIWDRNWRTASPVNPRPDCPVVVRAGDRPPLAMPGIDRVTLIGDSIMAQASCAVGESLSSLGVETYRSAVAGSGLLNGPVDWVTTMKTLLAEQHPDVVLAVFVGNVVEPGNTAGQRIEIDTPELFAAWQRRAEELSRVVRAAGAELYWVSPPPIAVPPLSHAQQLFDGYKTIDGDHWLDAGKSLAGDDGKEIADTITCGRNRRIRTSDRTHLTADGARIYGQSIAHELSADVGVLTSPRPC